MEGSISLDERLERIEANQRLQTDLIVDMRLAINALQVKSRLQGGVAGLVGGGLISGLVMVIGKII